MENKWCVVTYFAFFAQILKNICKRKEAVSTDTASYNIYLKVY